MAFVVTAGEALTSASLVPALRGTVASFAVPSRWHLQQEPLPTNHAQGGQAGAPRAGARQNG